MRIAVVGTRGVPDMMGGIETHCEELYPRMVKRGYDVIIFRRKNYVHDNLTEYEGCRLIDIATPRVKSLEVVVHTFKAILAAKRLGADVLHVHAIGPALLAPLAKMLGLKVVLTHHGSDYERDKWKWYAKAMLKLGERLGVACSDQIIVISRGIRHFLEKKYGRRDCRLIYNGVPEPSFSECPDYFADLGIEKGKYILGMSRIEEEKNLHHLIAAFSSADLKGYRLVIAGDTYYETEYSRGLREMAKKYQVVMTGFVRGEKLHSLLANACCFVLPSSHEGLPISLLEAMSYQLPVIVSDIPANVEMELPPTSYFPLGDIEALAGKIRRVAETAHHPQKYDLTRYDWEQIASQVDDVYRELADC